MKKRQRLTAYDDEYVRAVQAEYERLGGKAQLVQVDRFPPSRKKPITIILTKEDLAGLKR